MLYFIGVFGSFFSFDYVSYHSLIAMWNINTMAKFRFYFLLFLLKFLTIFFWFLVLFLVHFKYYSMFSYRSGNCFLKVCFVFFIVIVQLLFSMLFCCTYYLVVWDIDSVLTILPHLFSLFNIDYFFNKFFLNVCMYVCMCESLCDCVRAWGRVVMFFVLFYQ